MENSVIVRNLYKSFPKDIKKSSYVSIIEDVSIEIKSGEFVTFFGPNGCGKTTFLNVLSGLLPPDEGEILIQGKNPGTTKIGYIFQNFPETLFPWRKNIDNIAFPLELKGMSKVERYKNVIELERSLGIEIDNGLYPYKLSSGQQQLVAIARALIDQPYVLLMDEPFNALDFQTRVFVEDKILDIWEKTKTTILFVSHDIDESIYLADRVVFFTKMPAKIACIMEVNLPRPRHQQMMTSKEFFSLRSKAIEIFRKVMER
ncbi:ABC transporter ATP-binding protein [candidate division KSB1 bacterium]|nr:ABC transporter ATP-binding protein [candidate division KSB1 bacterium]